MDTELDNILDGIDDDGAIDALVAMIDSDEELEAAQTVEDVWDHIEDEAPAVVVPNDKMLNAPAKKAARSSGKKAKSQPAVNTKKTAKTEAKPKVAKPKTTPKAESKPKKEKVTSAPATTRGRTAKNYETRTAALVDRIDTKKLIERYGALAETWVDALEGLPKKVKDKGYNFLVAAAGSGHLSGYTRIAIDELYAAGTVSATKLVELYRARGYSLATSRAQAQQMISLLSWVGITDRAGKQLNLRKKPPQFKWEHSKAA
jgi:hypothetical protein